MTCYYKETFGLGEFVPFKIQKSINKDSFIKKRDDKEWNLIL